MSRRFHHKSRFGCVVCKRRRVKCDEAQPKCGECTKMRQQCSYPHALDRYNTISADSGISGALECSPLVVDKRSDSESRMHFDLLDLSLMHHYATDTFRHLFTGEGHSQVWQHHIPALASSHEVLMHSILALAALHRARAYPQQRDICWARALYHHGAVLPLFKGLVASVTPENAEVVVACAIALGIWIYASAETTSERFTLDDALGMFEIVRNSRSVFNLHRETIVGTPIGIFLIPPRETPLQGDEVDLTRNALQSLREQMEHPSDEKAASHLQMLMDQYLVGAGHARSGVNWMTSVGLDYWNRLRSHHPQALLIFTYSSLLTSAVEHECWWLAGWGERILMVCSEALTPGEKKKINWQFHEDLIQSRGTGLRNIARKCRV